MGANNSKIEIKSEKTKTINEIIKRRSLQIELIKSKLKTNIPTYSGIVFSGGGAKGFAHIGSLLILYTLYVDGYIKIKNADNTYVNDLLDIDKFVGTSIGAVFATLLALGYTTQEILDITLNIDFNKFKDNKGYFKSMYEIVYYFGLCPGDTVDECIGELIKKKTGDANYTFGQLYEKTHKILVIVGANVNKMCPLYFNYKDFPNMSIKNAIRISTSIPLLYVPVIMDTKTNMIKCKKESENDNYIVDGGIFDNFAIHTFDNEEIGKNYFIHNVACPYENQCYYDKININNEIIGINLFNDKVEPIGPERALKNIEITNIKDYVISLLNCYLYGNVNIYNHIHDEFWKRTILIETIPIPLTNFDINLDTKMTLINDGIDGTLKFYDKNIFNIFATNVDDREIYDFIDCITINQTNIDTPDNMCKMISDINLTNENNLEK